LLELGLYGELTAHPERLEALVLASKASDLVDHHLAPWRGAAGAGGGAGEMKLLEGGNSH
jgi:hypothetical protein